MKALLPLLFTSITSVTLALPQVAEAAESRETANAAEPDFHLTLDVAAGMALSQTSLGGLGATALLELPSHVSFGIGAEAAAGLSGRQRGGSALAGYRVRPSTHFALDLLGEAGVLAVSKADTAFFDETVSPFRTTLPFVGLRVGPAFEFGSPSGKILLGVWTYARYRPTQSSGTYTYRDGDGFGGSTGTTPSPLQSGTTSVGQSGEIGLTLRLGCDLGI